MVAGLILACTAVGQVPVDLNVERESIQRQIEVTRLDAELGLEQAQRMDDRSVLQLQVDQLQRRVQRIEQNSMESGLWSLLLSDDSDSAETAERLADFNALRRLLVRDYLHRIRVDELDARLRVAKASGELNVLQRLGAKGMASKLQRDFAQTLLERESAELQRLIELRNGLTELTARRWPMASPDKAAETPEQSSQSESSPAGELPPPPAPQSPASQPPAPQPPAAAQPR